VKITTRTAERGSPDRPPGLTSLEMRNVVLQGDRIFFRKQEHERVLATKAATEEISAFDGEKTRTVVAGNCVNIHLGRYEHPEVYRAHSLPLAHCLINFPLSVYLGGTEAILADSKYPRFERESGSIFELTRVETDLEGEEVVDGLRCVKVRVDRWSYSASLHALQYLWLAVDRNYFCVKERLTTSRGDVGGLPMREMHVEEMRELTPGLWFPMKLTVVTYDAQALKQKKQVAGIRTEMIVEEVDLAPRHENAFFRSVTIPADLPVFTIKDRSLVGSTLPEPTGGDQEKRQLAEVVAKVAEQENRYSDLEVKARVTFTSLQSSIRMENIITNDSHEVHSLLRGSSAYLASREKYSTLGGQRSERFHVRASDGEWTRSLDRSKRGGAEVQIEATLGKLGIDKSEGSPDRVPVYRPHMLLERYARNYGRMADFLSASWRNKLNNHRLRFRFCGEALVDDHPCVTLRVDDMMEGREQPGSSIVLFLATDRNHIPIRLEQYGGNSSNNALPRGVSRCDDFREIAPGTWFPFYVSELSFDDWMLLAQGRILVKWRREYQIESVQLSPEVDKARFHEVVVPEGTKVVVFDEDGSVLGEFDQPQEGVAAIAPARVLDLRSQAEATGEEARARRKAIEAMIGKPAPEFPQGALWLGSKPLTWESLRGKVVILAFWADWSEPCRAELPQLKLLHEARESNGLTVIGIHPPGSPPELINKVIDDLHLGFPTCVDVPAQRGFKAWGDLFSRFAVQAVPHAVAVDGKGTIVACGRLEDVRALASKQINTNR
jgi:thiol-disulfide isomerase/thioredoxin